jgi:hypothetical protein
VVHLNPIGVGGAGFARDIGHWHVDNRAARPGHHAVKLSLMDQIDGAHAKG